MAHDTTDLRLLKKLLLHLSDQVAFELRSQSYTSHGIGVSVRYDDFSWFQQERKTSVHSQDGLSLFKQAWNLLQKSSALFRPVRALGVRAFHLSKTANQPSLFSEDRKREQCLTALDTLRAKYGSKAWTRASLIHTSPLKHCGGFR